MSDAEMPILFRQDQAFELRLARETDVSALRQLLNDSYRELADRGLNYTATYQDERETLKQMQSGRAFCLFFEGELVGTVNVRDEDWLGGRRSAYVGKLAVRPDRKGEGLGKWLLEIAEQHAREHAYECVQLDTAKPAEHLVGWYLRSGYRVIAETRFEGKTYESWIFEKSLS